MSVNLNPVIANTPLSPLLGFGRRLVLFGDSITNQNVVLGGTATQYHAAGYFVQANIELGWPFDIAADAGVSSDTTTLMLARLYSDVLSVDAEWVCVMGGINDLPLVSAATTIANLQAIYDRILASGRRVLACTITPATAHTTTPAYGFKRNTVNAWIKRYGAQKPGIVVADTCRAILDTATGGPASNTTIDGTHPSNIGARLMGRAIAAAVSPYVSSYSRLADSNQGYGINPLAQGSNSSGSGGFTAETGWSGVGPNGWDAGVRNTGTATGSKVTRSGDWRPEGLFRMAASFAADFDGVYVRTGGSGRSGVTKGRYDLRWAANTAYVLSDRRKPSTDNGYHYVAITAGTSHATTEPTWPTTEGATVTDGTVTWRCHATPVNGDQFIAVCEFDASSLVGGAQPVLRLNHGYTDGTVQDAVACGYIDLANGYGAAPSHIPATGQLVTPPMTLDFSTKSIRYLYAELAVYGPAGGSVNLDITRFGIVKL